MDGDNYRKLEANSEQDEVKDINHNLSEHFKWFCIAISASLFVAVVITVLAASSWAIYNANHWDLPQTCRIMNYTIKTDVCAIKGSTGTIHKLAYQSYVYLMFTNGTNHYYAWSPISCNLDKQLLTDQLSLDYSINSSTTCYVDKTNSSKIYYEAPNYTTIKVFASFGIIGAVILLIIGICVVGCIIDTIRYMAAKDRAKAESNVKV